MTLELQSKLLAWLAGIIVLVVFATSALAAREVREQTRQMEMAEFTARGVSHLRYLIMETTLYRERRALAQWRQRMTSFQSGLAAHHYGGTMENALLARQRSGAVSLAALFDRLARANVAGIINDATVDAGARELTAATVANLFLTSEDMIDDAFELMRLKRLDVKRAQDAAIELVLVNVLVLVGLIFASAMIIRRRVLKPVAVLRAVTEQVAAGDLRLRLHMRERNEIGLLGDSFDRMTGHLRQSHERLEAENAERRQAQGNLQRTIEQLAAKSVELARAQANLQMIIDHTPALVVYWDKDLRNRFANMAYQTWVGISPADMRGMHMRAVIGYEPFAAIEAPIASVLQGNSEMFERKLRFADGSDRHCLFSYIPDLLNGEVQGFYGFISDISQLKLAQADALARLESVVDAATDFAIVAANLDGQIVLFSTGAERMLGYRADDMIGIATPAAFHRPDELAARAHALEAQYGRRFSDYEVFTHRARHGASESRDWTYVRSNGGEVPVNLTVTAVRDARGEPIGFLCVAKDIGKERAILKALARARDDAEAASLAKSQFLANMSHEISTPMNAVLGMLQLLHFTELSALQADYAGNAQAAAQSLLRLINDILDFSKVEAGKVTLETAPFALASLARELANVAAPLIGDKQIALAFDIDPRLPTSLVGDALRLRQVLLNLIGNAIKFTEQGAVRVSVRFVPGIAPARVEFAVQDSGIGIAPDKLADIFEVFSQAEASTMRRFGGTGLGLSISRRLVLLMGGTLEVSSTVGVGSRFAFSLALPASAGSASSALSAQSVPTARQMPQRLSGARILVVDDNALNQMVARGLLCSEGAHVEVASGGAAALAMLHAASVPYDAVLMDVQMPDMDGYQSTRALRADARLRALPVIAMTANVMSGDRDACIAAGMDDYLEKPIDVDAMVAVLARYWRGGRRRQPHRAPALARIDGAGAGAREAVKRMGGNVQLYLGMAQRYPHEARMLVEQLCAHLRRQQWHEAAAACHTLRGVSATLGADALAAHVGVIEERSRSGALAGAEAAVCDTVEAMLEASLAQLAQACAVLRGEPIG